MNVKIQEIRSEHLDSYKKLIVRGLMEDEESFRISPEDEELEGFPTLDSIESFTLGAFDQDRLVGVASFTRDGHNRRKLRHKGVLFKLYVDPGFRGKGIAKKIIIEIIERVRSIEGIEQINLTVVPANAKAKYLYESLGFKTFASEENAIKWKGKYFREDQMKLIL